jgi:hypothetical protein
MPNNPNPQGKGLVPLLQGLDRHRLGRLLPPKQIEQVEMELFTSMFVLQSEFCFNPVPNRAYFLYQKEGVFRLLLVAPHEWGSTPYQGRFIGSCILHDDRTWTLALDPAMEHDKDFMAHIVCEQNKLQRALEHADTLEDILPVFVENFSYYGRILAFILGKSLSISMDMAGIKSLTYNEARGLLFMDKTNDKANEMPHEMFHEMAHEQQIHA